MFTGIVAGTGKIKKVIKKQGFKVQIQSSFPLKGARPGDSIAVDGCCLTFTQLKGRDFWADLSPETLAKTSLKRLRPGQGVNLELPLKMGDPLGGHWVQGHVDGVGTLVSKGRDPKDGADIYRLEVQIPPRLRRYMIPKGSVAVDGVSLTINEVKRDKILLCIIPHTSRRTALTAKGVGASLNIEADCLLKFMEQRLKAYFPKAMKKS